MYKKNRTVKHYILMQAAMLCDAVNKGIKDFSSAFSG